MQLAKGEEHAATKPKPKTHQKLCTWGFQGGFRSAVQLLPGGNETKDKE